MNRDVDKERPVPSDQDNVSVQTGGATGHEDAGAGRPGTTDVQAYIGRQLRAVYDDVAKQPIPDRFLALMRQLEGQTPKS